MPLKIPQSIRHPHWRFIFAALIAAAILHICATMAAPYLTGESAYSRLAPALPINKVRILDPVAPGAEPLPFFAPDARYAVCRFDTGKGPVSVAATLPADVGWTITVHAPNGNNLYAAASNPNQATPILLMLIPSSEQFLGVTPEARGIARSTQPPQAISAQQGIVIVRGPQKGLAYTHVVAAQLKKLACSGPAF